MKMLLLLEPLLILFSFANCNQNLYSLIPEHCEIKNVNRTFVDKPREKCYKVSRSELYLNVSFYLLVDILNDHMGQVKITGYQFRSNEYRKGPIEFMLGVCSALLSKDFGIPDMLAHSNFKCPLKKGIHYFAYMVKPNATSLPPLLPGGRWMLQLDFLYLNKYLMTTIEWYTEISYLDRFVYDKM